MSYRAILRENNIAVIEMFVEEKRPVIVVPIIGALTARSYCEGTSLSDSQDISMGVKTYGLAYETHDTLFYDLIARKESKKMKEDCCDEKEKPYRILLLGFKADGEVVRVDSFRTPISTSNAEAALLEIAETNKGYYHYMKLIALNRFDKTIYCKDINFKTTTIVKATLC